LRKRGFQKTSNPKCTLKQEAEAYGQRSAQQKMEGIPSFRELLALNRKKKEPSGVWSLAEITRAGGGLQLGDGSGKEGRGER